MRGFTETDESYFKSGKLQMLADRCAAAVALQCVVVSSLLPDKKFLENDGKKKKKQVTELKQ